MKVLGFFLISMGILFSCASSQPSTATSGQSAQDHLEAAKPEGKKEDAPQQAAGTATDGKTSASEGPRDATTTTTLSETEASGVSVSGEPPNRPELPTQSGLRAGFSDDNKEYNRFISFLERYGPEVVYEDLKVHERIVLRFKDSKGQGASTVRVKIKAGSERAVEGVGLADGSFLFFPSKYGPETRTFEIEAQFEGQIIRQTIQRNGPREIELNFTNVKTVQRNTPVDLLFVLDTTGTMSEEIERIKTTLEIIHLNLSSLASKPNVRFGMVLYKDRGDEYVTKIVPLTSDLPAFQKVLDEVTADGGGDAPEDMIQALDDAVHRIDWSPQGVRQIFLITDAPPQFYPDAQAHYGILAQSFHDKGIKIFAVGTGGLPLSGEFVLRQLAQYTGGRYIFLTYGEQNESEGGASGSVSHHSGANFQTDKLETIIIRFAREDILAFTGIKDPEPEDYFEARKISSEEKEKTLEKLFAQALGQLLSFSSWKISKNQAIAVLPLINTPPVPASEAEYFTNQMLLSAVRHPEMTVVDRKEIERVLQEMEFSLSGLVDEKNVPQVGKILGAQALIGGSLLLRNDEYEIYLKLIRVETGEILSLTKARVAKALGL